MCDMGHDGGQEAMLSVVGYLVGKISKESGGQ